MCIRDSLPAGNMHQGHIGLLLRLDQAVGQLAVTDKGFAGLQVVGEEKGFPLPGGGLCVDFGRSHNGMPVQQPAQKRQMLRPRSAAAAQQGSSGGQQPLRLLRKMRRVQRNHSACLLYTSHRIEKLPIVDENGYLKGLITIKDIEKAVKYPNSARDKDCLLYTSRCV